MDGDGQVVQDTWQAVKNVMGEMLEMLQTQEVWEECNTVMAAWAMISAGMYRNSEMMNSR